MNRQVTNEITYFLQTYIVKPKLYLAYDRILACGGSWMVKNDLVKAGDFEKITELVREAAAIVKEVRG